MRGDDDRQSGMFSYVPLEQRIPQDHPLRQIRVLVDRALQRMDAVFGWMKHDRLRQIKLRGLRRVDWMFQLAAAAHNLLRMGKMIPIQANA
jgi:hypothetical protein